MVKKLQVSGTLWTEQFQLLGIVSQLADYRLSHFINVFWHINLKKYKDFFLEEGNEFSWYFYSDENTKVYYYLISNRNKTGFLIKELKQFDYLFLIKGRSSEELLLEKMNQLRNIQQVIGVFQHNLQKVKTIDAFLEALEMHELQVIKIPSKPKKYPFQQ